MPKQARWYAYAVIAAGSVALGASLGGGPHIDNALTFSVYLALAVATSLFQMRRSGGHGSSVGGADSANALFIVFGLYFLNLPQTMIAGCAAAAVQALFRTGRANGLVRFFFKTATVSLSIASAFAVMHVTSLGSLRIYIPALMAAAVLVQFTVGTAVESGLLSLLQAKPFRQVCGEWYEWSFPFYLAAAVGLGVLPVRGQSPHPEALIVLLALVYLLHFFGVLSISSRALSPRPEASAESPKLPARARLYVNANVIAGILLVTKAVMAFDLSGLERFFGYLILGMIVATWKVRLPGMPATISVGFVMSLVAITDLPFSQAIMIAIALGLTQVFWKPKRPAVMEQAVFSVSNLVICTAVTHWLIRSGLPEDWANSLPATLAVATGSLFFLNTVMVSVAVGLAQARPVTQIWRGCSFWSFPYYLVGACAAGVMVETCRTAGWVPSIVVMPLMGMVYISYRLRVDRVVAGVMNFDSLSRVPGA